MPENIFQVILDLLGFVHQLDQLYTEADTDEIRSITFDIGYGFKLEYEIDRFTDTEEYGDYSGDFEKRAYFAHNLGIHVQY